MRGHGYLYRGRSMAPFRVDRYRWPHGYGYRRYAVGYRLPRALIVQDYYIDNYDYYGFDAPPEDDQWVRCGPDALLVALADGSVVQSVDGVFEEADAGPADGETDQGAPQGDPG